MKTAITPEIMEKAWKLHEKNIDSTLISETLGISKASAVRIIHIMETAKNGGDVDALSGNNHQKQKDFAKKFFGLEIKEKEQPSEKQIADENNVATFMVRVLFALERQNELLEKLCAEWGVCDKEKND